MTKLVTVQLTKEVEVFDLVKLPNMASCRDDAKYRVSFYRDVLVLWDEDDDTRVLAYIDSLADHERYMIAAVQEHEGSINIMLRHQYGEYQGTVYPGDGDAWSTTYYAYDKTCDQWVQVS